MTEWWTGIPAATARIECGGHTHTLHWERGVLAAVDHDDLEGESTLATLAGKSVPCLEHVRAWNRHRDDVRVLTLASRGFTDQLHVTTERRPHPRAGTNQGADDDLRKLLALGSGLPDRLQGHVTAAWAQRLTAGHPELEAAMPQLQVALYGRLLLATRLWLAEPQLSIDVTMVDHDSDRRLQRRGNNLAVSLPFSWLTEVWARGLTTIFGRFCLAANTEDAADWTLNTIGPDLNAITRLSITIPS